MYNMHMIRRLFTAHILINRCVIRAPDNHGIIAIRRHHTQKITKDVSIELSKIRNNIHCLSEKVDRNKAVHDRCCNSIVYMFLTVFTSLVTCTILMMPAELHSDNYPTRF